MNGEFLCGRCNARWEQQVEPKKKSKNIQCPACGYIHRFKLDDEVNNLND